MAVLKQELVNVEQEYDKTKEFVIMVKEELAAMLEQEMVLKNEFLFSCSFFVGNECVY